MRTLEVSVPRLNATSSVHIGAGLLSNIKEIVNVDRYTKVAVVADRGAARQWLEPLTQALDIATDHCLVLEGGEQTKDVSGLQRIWEYLVGRQCDRRSLVVTLGGGATSDLSGFAAATFMRGIACVNIPTTLLAQVDASIGGKTGINLLGAKNVVGSIVQPAHVIIDIDTLGTLPPRAIRSGFAEIVKHGLISDREYFDHVTSKECSAWTPQEIEKIVTRSCEIKRDVVQADETETGLRKTLNFGHTIGHALEGYALDNDISLTHGEAVAIGMAAECRISMRLGRLTEEAYGSIIKAIAATGLPTRMSTKISPAALLPLVARDKKNVGGVVKWALLKQIGEADFDVTVPDELITDAFASVNP